MVWIKAGSGQKQEFKGLAPLSVCLDQRSGLVLHLDSTESVSSGSDIPDSYVTGR